ncbi:MAG: outer membrane lipoprotein chaperone LolA [Abyssibacter sp.]|uniref:outer membrane lipoprotein chaperone LolA n=1 Tax=Abyssibacter sp. TaxID=2320200 RepID=UPI00321BEA8D
MARVLLNGLTWLVVGMVGVWGNPAQASADELAEALSSTQALAGVFEQQLLDSDDTVIEASRGSFALQRPGRFRWDYEQPYVQQVMSNGDTLWHYDRDLAQVTVRSVGSALSGTPAALLSGATDLKARFVVRELGPGRYALEPKDSDAEFEAAIVEFDQGVIAALDIRDALGQRTRIEFSDVARNVSFKPGWFEFEPPPGVEVVGESGS